MTVGVIHSGVRRPVHSGPRSGWRGRDPTRPSPAASPRSSAGLTRAPVLASAPVLANMSMPPRTLVSVEKRPVWRRATVLSIELALVAAGLLELRTDRDGRPTTTGLQSEAMKRWGGDVERMLADAEAAGALDRERLRAERAPRGVIIGWRPSLSNRDWALSTDLALTVLVLERRVGELYLGGRAPDRSWEHLFEGPFAVDDPRVEGRPLLEVLASLAPRQKRPARRDSRGSLNAVRGRDGPHSPAVPPAPAAGGSS